MPRDPTCPFNHCPAEKSSRCFPIIPEIPPCLPLRPQDCPLPSPHPPTPTSLPPLTPSRVGSPFSQPRQDILGKTFPNPLPSIRAILSSLLFGTCHYLESLILFYFVLVCLPPPNRSSRKPGDLAQLDRAASSRPIGQVLQIITAK